MDYTYFVDENGIVNRLHVEPDTAPWNPRKDSENIGEMFCLHRRYILGDKVPYSTVLDMKYVMLHYAGIILGLVVNAVRKGSVPLHICLNYDRHQREWELRRNSGTLVAHEHSLEFLEEDIIDELTVPEIISITKGKLVALPLFLYDHSVLAMRTESSVGKAVHAEWDSGQVGWIWTTVKKAEKVSGVKKPSVEWIKKALEAEVRTYSQYLEGDAYGYIVEKYEDSTWIETDSCWGYYPAGNDALAEISDDVFGHGQWSNEEPAMSDAVSA